MIIVISGPGGVGKGSIVERLLDLDPQLWLSRSWTTRARRPGEPEDAYVWVDRERFERRLAEGGFLEFDNFLGQDLYGTPTVDPPPDKDVLLEINVQGAEQVRAQDPSALLVFVVAPSPEAQEQRLRRRGDSDEHVAKRLAVAAAEEVKGRRLADAVVVNDDLDRAAAEVAGIIDERRPRLHPA